MVHKPPDDPTAASHRLTPAALHVLLALADQDRHGLGIADHIEAFTHGSMSLEVIVTGFSPTLAVMATPESGWSPLVIAPVKWHGR